MPAGDAIRGAATSAASFGERALGFLEDAPFRLRYGVPAAEKYRMAVTGQIPGGAVPRNEAETAQEERRAAGFLFGKSWPSLAVPGTHLANAIRFWEDPSLHATALDAARMGAAAAGQAQGGSGFDPTAAMQASALRSRSRVR